MWKSMPSIPMSMAMISMLSAPVTSTLGTKSAVHA
jgi:hypothetical protein